MLFDSAPVFGDMRRLVSELTPLPVIVLKPHTHYDHIGGNHAFDIDRYVAEFGLRPGRANVAPEGDLLVPC